MINVMLSGLPGKMATEVAKEIMHSEGFNLLPFALTGPRKPRTMEVIGRAIRLISPANRDNELREIKTNQANFYCVDFSKADSALDNALSYWHHKIPFVMGTTGASFHSTKMNHLAESNYAVIAPNMCPQIVALQETMKHMAKNFPGIFDGFEIKIIESHQSSKTGVSGTAIAMLPTLKILGLNCDKKDIVSLRDKIQIHAFHAYFMDAMDVEVKFGHKVYDLKPYAEGTLLALKFLHEKVQAKQPGLYNMVDVLKTC